MDEQPPPGTPAEFVTMVHRTAVGPTPLPRGPLPKTMPTDSELAAPVMSGESIAVPAPRPISPPAVNIAKPRRSRRWVWYLVIPLVLGGAGYLAYTQVDDVREYVDGIIDAAA